MIGTQRSRRPLDANRFVERATVIPHPAAWMPTLAAISMLNAAIVVVFVGAALAAIGIPSQRR